MKIDMKTTSESSSDTVHKCMDAENMSAASSEAMSSRGDTPNFCRFCHAPLRQTLVDLGNVAAVRELREPAKNLNRMEPFYPLHVAGVRQVLSGSARGIMSARNTFSPNTLIFPLIPTPG